MFGTHCVKAAHQNADLFFRLARSPGLTDGSALADHLYGNTFRQLDGFWQQASPDFAVVGRSAERPRCRCIGPLRALHQLRFANESGVRKSVEKRDRLCVCTCDGGGSRRRGGEIAWHVGVHPEVIPDYRTPYL